MMGCIDSVSVFYVGPNIDCTCTYYLHYSVGVEWIITVSACSMLVPMLISEGAPDDEYAVAGVNRPSKLPIRKRRSRL